jgi:hypothetical protein
VPFVGLVRSGTVALLADVYCSVLVTVTCETHDESAAGAVAKAFVAWEDNIDEKTARLDTDAVGEVARTDVRLADADADADTLAIVDAAVDEALVVELDGELEEELERALVEASAG